MRRPNHSRLVARLARVLDVGTGSGILAQAAALLGAGKVYACDLDPVAVEIAGNGFVGSADAVATGSTDPVVANINPETIVRIAPDLLRVLRSGGVLLTSGLELADVEQVKAALPSDEVRRKGNWPLTVTSTYSDR
jgi:ribosomal protein L11 methyltransferase